MYLPWCSCQKHPWPPRTQFPSIPSVTCPGSLAWCVQKFHSQEKSVLPCSAQILIPDHPVQMLLAPLLGNQDSQQQQWPANNNKLLKKAKIGINAFPQFINWLPPLTLKSPLPWKKVLRHDHYSSVIDKYSIYYFPNFRLVNWVWKSSKFMHMSLLLFYSKFYTIWILYPAILAFIC